MDRAPRTDSADAAITNVLVVQFWVNDLDPIRDALEGAGLVVKIRRVDIEPALHAALVADRYQLVIFDPATPTLSRAVVERRLRAMRPQVPLITADDLPTLGARALAALRARLS